MSKQIQIRVNKIESYRDINGSLGKKIELIEEHEDHSNAIQETEEQQIVNSVLLVMNKTMPGVLQKIVSPKMILYLTEEEYDSLGVTLDVNQTYQVTFESQAIKFNKEEPKQ